MFSSCMCIAQSIVITVTMWPVVTMPSGAHWLHSGRQRRIPILAMPVLSRQGLPGASEGVAVTRVLHKELIANLCHDGGQCRLTSGRGSCCGGVLLLLCNLGRLPAQLQRSPDIARDSRNLRSR